MRLRAIIFALMFTIANGLFANNANVAILARLDNAIDSSKVYLQKKENELKRLKGNLSLALTSTDKYLTCAQLAEAYSHYRSDSALVYYQRCYDIAKKENNDVWRERAVIGQALVFANRGDNFISMRRLHSLGNIEDVDPLLRADYVRAMMANYVRSTSSISKEFNYSNAFEAWKQYKAYIPENSIDYLSFTMLAEKRYDARKIVASIKRILGKTKSPSYESASCHMQLHIAYIVLGDKEASMREAALAEIDNLKLSDRSSPALTRLVEMLYSKNSSGKDLKRIIRYLEVCMDDINCFQDVGRGIHVVQLQNDILKRYQEAMAHDRDISMTVILLLAVAITVLLWVARRRKYKLMQAGRQQQAKQDARSEQLGSIMARQYRLLGMALTDVRQHKKEIANLITSGQNQKAVKMAKGSVLRDKTVEEYYQAFDRDFLSVYPDFIDNVNATMRPDSQLKPDKPGSLSPELRICALNSLGVADPKTIAEILQYSVQTVYNYSMRIRKGKIASE